VRLLPNLLVTREDIDRGTDVIAAVLAKQSAAVNG